MIRAAQFHSRDEAEQPPVRGHPGDSVSRQAQLGRLLQPASQAGRLLPRCPARAWGSHGPATPVPHSWSGALPQPGPNFSAQLSRFCQPRGAALRLPAASSGVGTGQMMPGSIIMAGREDECGLLTAWLLGKGVLFCVFSLLLAPPLLPSSSGGGEEGGSGAGVGRAGNCLGVQSSKSRLPYGGSGFPHPGASSLLLLLLLPPRLSSARPPIPSGNPQKTHNHHSQNKGPPSSPSPPKQASPSSFSLLFFLFFSLCVCCAEFPADPAWKFPAPGVKASLLFPFVLGASFVFPRPVTRACSTGDRGE